MLSQIWLQLMNGNYEILTQIFPVIIILFSISQGTAHSAILYVESKDDPPQLIEARKEVGQLIGRWLEYWKPAVTIYIANSTEYISYSYFALLEEIVAAGPDQKPRKSSWLPENKIMACRWWKSGAKKKWRRIRVKSEFFPVVRYYKHSVIVIRLHLFLDQSRKCNFTSDV